MNKPKIFVWLAMFFLLSSPVFAQDGTGEVFTISTSYNNLLSNPEQTGMLDRILHEVFLRLGMEMELVFTPTEKSLVDVNAGLLDAEMNRISGMESSFPNLVQVPEPNMTMHFVAFAKKDLPIDGWESLKDYYIGMVRGWKILENNTRDFPHVVRTPTEIELFTMLQKDRLDAALYSLLTGYAVLKDRGITGVQHIEPPLASRDMYLYVHKKHALLAGPIAEVLREMKADGTYQNIVKETTEGYIQ